MVYVTQSFSVEGPEIYYNELESVAGETNAWLSPLDLLP